MGLSDPTEPVLSVARPAVILHMQVRVDLTQLVLAGS